MTEGCRMVKFPDDARVVEREPETDEEIVRRMPVRGMLRRMMRNKGYTLVEITPAQTPFETIVEWAAELTGRPSHAELDDLAVRLRDALALEEDGGLAGHLLLAAIDGQADRMCDWKLKNKLRFLAGHVELTLREMGLL